MNYTDFLKSFENCSLNHTNHTKSGLLDDKDFNKIVAFLKEEGIITQQNFDSYEYDFAEQFEGVKEVIEEVIYHCVDDFGDKYPRFAHYQISECAEAIMCEVMNVTDLAKYM